MMFISDVNFIFLKFMKKISAVIVAHNEEKKIRDCLRSIDFVDEIVVVLDRCSDNTKQITLEFKAKIIEGSWELEGVRRNIALSSASCEWILEIDCDERVSDELKNDFYDKLGIPKTMDRIDFIDAIVDRVKTYYNQ